MSEKDTRCGCGGARWIPVSERLPDYLSTVLVSWGNVVELASCIDGVWYDENDNEMSFGIPEAWMPLPKSYKGANV